MFAMLHENRAKHLGNHDHKTEEKDMADMGTRALAVEGEGTLEAIDAVCSTIVVATLLRTGAATELTFEDMWTFSNHCRRRQSCDLGRQQQHKTCISICASFGEIPESV